MPKKHWHSQNGWTLTETLVVVIILGLLVTIGVPIFQGQRSKAANSVAQTNLENAYRASRAFNLERWPATELLIDQMRSGEPVFQYVNSNETDTSGPREISLSVDDPNMLTMCTKSSTRLVYCLRADELGQIPTDPLTASSWSLVPKAYAQSSEGLARSTGADEQAAREALPSRQAEGSLNARNARGWQNCVGSCAS